MTLEGQIITKHLEMFNDSIRDTLKSKNINDTGNAADSLKVVQDGEKYQSVGSDYIEVLDQGRGAGKYAPVDKIQDWVKSKLGITEDKEMRSVAFLVNRKIKEEGTAIFKDKTKGLQIDLKIEEMLPNLVKDLQVFAKADVLKQLDKFKSQKV